MERPETFERVSERGDVLASFRFSPPGSDDVVPACSSWQTFGRALPFAGPLGFDSHLPESLLKALPTTSMTLGPAE
jgi:hypothetical protein